jgi:outer membrane receptor protein involved in Fe transport
MGVHTVEGLAGIVPTVTISQHTGLAQVTIRGIGSNSTFGDPSSTVHLDGVYLGRPAMVFADFLNVERVEVLRGPQGTLYGRNSVGGTINIVTRQPSNTLETSVRLTAGDYQEFRAESTVSGPLITNTVMAISRSSAARARGREGSYHPDHRRQRRHVGRTRAAACRPRDARQLLSAIVVNTTGSARPC